MSTQTSAAIAADNPDFSRPDRALDATGLTGVVTDPKPTNAALGQPAGGPAPSGNAADEDAVSDVPVDQPADGVQSDDGDFSIDVSEPVLLGVIPAGSENVLVTLRVDEAPGQSSTDGAYLRLLDDEGEAIAWTGYFWGIESFNYLADEMVVTSVHDTIANDLDMQYVYLKGVVPYDITVELDNREAGTVTGNFEWIADAEVPVEIADLVETIVPTASGEASFTVDQFVGQSVGYIAAGSQNVLIEMDAEDGANLRLVSSGEVLVSDSSFSALLSGAEGGTIEWNGLTITYSGTGAGEVSTGREFIYIEGTLPVSLTIGVTADFVSAPGEYVRSDGLVTWTSDQLVGGGGNDLLNGGNGVDTLHGYAGHDVLYGEAGDDYLSGGSDNDTASGGGGADRLFGGGGTDTLYGGAQNDTLDGGAGDDKLYGDDGDDYLDGGDGNDLLKGGNGVDTLHGYADDDVLYGDAGDDYLSGGAGNDAASGGVGADRLFGGGGTDTLYGGAQNDTLDGGLGDDKLYGDDGDDYLDGDDGNDLLKGGNGVDTLHGYAGDDVLYGDAGDDYLSGGAGNDAASGGVGADRLFGGGGTDTLYGGAQNDTLDGGLGDDKLYGDDGDDYLDGGDGNDLLKGGNGVDTLHGYAGNDILYGDAGDDYLSGGAGNDAVAGGGGADRLFGGGGTDTLYGGAQNDSLDGGIGDDKLYGDDGDDYLDGGDGNDLLKGGAGNDTLEGGAGVDTAYIDDEFGPIRVEDLGNGRVRLTSKDGVDVFTSVEFFEFADGSTLSLQELTGSIDQTPSGIGGALDFVIEGVPGTFGGSGVLAEIPAGSENVLVKLDANFGDTNFIGNGINLVLTDGPLAFSSLTPVTADWNGTTLYYSGRLFGDEFLYFDGVLTSDVQLGVRGYTGDSGSIVWESDVLPPAPLLQGPFNLSNSGQSELIDRFDQVVFPESSLPEATLSGRADIDVALDEQQVVAVIPAGATDISIELDADGYSNLNLQVYALSSFEGGSNMLAGDFGQVVGGPLENSVTPPPGFSTEGATITYTGSYNFGDDPGDETITIDGTFERPVDLIVTVSGFYEAGSGTVTWTAVDAQEAGESDGTLIDEGSDRIPDGGDLPDGGDVPDGSSASDVIDGGSGNDQLFGRAGDDILLGGDGTDELLGGSGNDYLDGGAEDDTLEGGSGDDVLLGGTGADVLEGGTGSDVFIYDAGGGTDIWQDFVAADGDRVELDESWVNGLDADALFAAFGAVDGDDYVLDFGGGNSIRFVGITSASEVTTEVAIGIATTGVITPQPGRNVNGTNSDDTLYGGAGADQIVGLDGNDVLNGDDGDDYLDGGGGDDLLNGGTGSDNFVFRAGYDADTIADFEAGFDTLDLTGFGFSSAAEALAEASDNGGDVVFDFGNGDVLTVSDITRAQLVDDILV